MGVLPLLVDEGECGCEGKITSGGEKKRAQKVVVADIEGLISATAVG